MKLSEYKCEEEQLCRLCGKMQQNVIQFFDDFPGDLMTLIRRTLGYLNIELIYDGVSPLWLCATCHLDAQTTDRFLLKVEQGQRNLRQQIQENSETSDKPTIVLEIDCKQSSLDSSENRQYHEIFEIKEIQEPPPNTLISEIDPLTSYIKTEDYAMGVSTLVENRLQNELDLNPSEAFYYSSTTQHQQQHCASVNECTEVFPHNNDYALHMHTHIGDTSLGSGAMACRKTLIARKKLMEDAMKKKRYVENREKFSKISNKVENHMTREKYLEKKREAERARRRKIKEDPVLYNEYLRKERERYLKSKEAKNIKMITQLTEREKRTRRKYQNERKRKSRFQQKHMYDHGISPDNHSPNPTS